jgi:hypothetical protein
VRTDVSAALVGVDVQAADAASVAARWAVILGAAARPCGGGTHAIDLDGSVLRFVPPADGRGDGLAAIELRMTDRARALAAARTRDVSVDGDAVVIGGTLLRFS